MSCARRRATGAAFGALLIGLLSAPTCSADPSDLAHIGPIFFDGYTEAFTYNTSDAFDSFTTGSANLVPYDLDVFWGTPGAGDLGVLFTIPLLYQGGFEDIDGTITPISTFDAADFLAPDTGLLNLSGVPPASQAVESIGPISIGGDSDVFSINTNTLAVDNLLTGSYNMLPFDLDLYSGAPGAGSYEVVFTIPSLFQAGFDDVAGTITPLFSINPDAFVAPDIGLTLIGGV